MAWPSGSITTDNVDQGIDRPRIARHQIRQSHVDANAITDEFGTVDNTGVADGNVLGYDGTKWFPSNNLIINSANYPVTIVASDSFDPADTYTADPTVTVSKNDDFLNDYYIDRNDYIPEITVSPTLSTNNPTIVAGTYDIRIQGPWGFEVIRTSGASLASITPTISLIDTDSSTTLGSFTSKVPASLTNDLDPTANEYEHLLYTSLSLRHTFTVDTAVNLRASLTITRGGATSAGGLFKIGAALQVRLTKI